jgi:hypothetical protein
MLKLAVLFSLTLICCTGAAKAQNGDYWCYAKSRWDQQLFLRSGHGIENAKHAARNACSAVLRDCEVTECYMANPYNFTCIAAHRFDETKKGGFQSFSNDQNNARFRALSACRQHHRSQCDVLCVPNFQPRANILLQDE